MTAAPTVPSTPSDGAMRAVGMTGADGSGPVPRAGAGHVTSDVGERRREAERLAALRRYEVLDTPDEEAFDRVVRLACALFGTPIADVSLIDENRQWLKASSVPDRPREAPRAWSFCAHAIRADDVTVVPDAREDERFRTNPFVTGEPGIRFYAAAPLRTPDGHNVGTLCVISPESRAGFDETDERKLQALADIVVSELELRRRRRADSQILTRLLENSSDCVTILGLDGTLQFMNEGGQALMEVDDIRVHLGRPWMGLWRGAARTALLSALQLARTGASHRFEELAETVKGTRRWWDVLVSPIPGEDGKPERLLAVSRDVTERKRAEEALRESEARLRFERGLLDAVFRHAPVGISVTEAPTGRSIMLNDKARELIGHGGRGEDARRYEGYGAVHPDGRPYAVDEYPTMRALRRGEAVDEEEMLYRRGGQGGAEFTRLAVSSAPVRDEAGAIVAAVTVVVDVERQRRAAEELRESAAQLADERTRLATLIEHLPVGVAFVAPDGTSLLANPAYRRFVPDGRLPSLAPDAEERWHGWCEHGQRLPRDRYVGARVLRGETVRGADFLHCAPSGTKTWTRVSGVPLREGDGRVTAALLVIVDIDEQKRAQEALQRLNETLEARVEARTAELREAVDALRAEAQERERAEAALRQAQKMEAVGQLTGGLAHDFNNLLMGITGSLERMQVRLAQGKVGDVERYVTVAQGAAKRAAALTHRLLAFSRRQTLDPRPTDVNRLVAGMEELIRRTVGPGIEVEVVAAGGLWTTLIDPGQLENALLNLCINARDAMPDSGRLTIETGNRWLDERVARERDLAPGQYVSLCVSDTGSGMTPDVIARAFDPFYTTKPIGMGTGLGLSMVYGFARQSGGQARIYSEPGQGAMVCLYLPRHHGEAESTDDLADGRRHEVPLAGQGRTVLVVDDEPAVRMLVAEVLEELGCVAIEAEDSAAGLRVLQSGARIDLLITDVGLPGGMNGRQMADAGCAMRPRLPVLFITGYAENAVVGNGQLAPGMQMLTKPFAMDALAARVRAVMAAG